MCCSETHNSSAVALIATIFVSKIKKKQSVFCLKSKSLNFNLLLVEILLYKISVTLQSCWYRYSGKLLFRETSWPSNVEIDRYIVLLIFKHFTIIRYLFCNIGFTNKCHHLVVVLRIAHRIAIVARLRGDETTTTACTGTWFCCS